MVFITTLPFQILAILMSRTESKTVKLYKPRSMLTFNSSHLKPGYAVKKEIIFVLTGGKDA